MRRAQDEEVAAPYHIVEREKVAVGGHEWIGGEHRLSQARERLLELIAQRGASIVDIRLECHAEQPDGHPRKIIAPAQVIADVEHQAFVDEHGGIAETELILGKSGKLHRVDLQDRRLARIVKRFLEIPGQELFQFLDESGEAKPIDSADVNAYLRDISGEDFTAKDFRTWAGTILAARFLRETITRPNTRGAKKQLVHAIARVADELGNTPAVCKKGYVHPAVIAAYLAGGLKPVKEKDDVDPYKLSPEERSLLALLSAEAS